MPNTNLREKLIELVMDHCITDETESGLYRRSDINRYTDMYLLELLEDNLGLEFQPESFDDSSDFKVWDGLGDDDSMVSPAGWFGPYPDNPAEKGCKCDPATCKCNPCNCKG